MRRLKNLNFLQLVINILLVVGEALGLYFTITSDITNGISPTTLLKYYTELTAIITSVVALMCIAPNIIGIKKKLNATPHWLSILGYISAVMNILTFLVVAIFLRPIGFAWKEPIDLLFDVKSGSLFQHFLCPLLSMILFFFFAIASKAKFRQTFMPLLASTVYAVAILLGVVIIYYTQGAEAAGKFAPYFFFRVIPGTELLEDTTNYLQNLGIAGIVLLMTYVISFMAWCINRLMSLIVIGYAYQGNKKPVKNAKDSFDALGSEQENYSNVYHISYHDRRLKTWKVKSEGAKRAIKVFNTQKEAIEYANGQVKLHGGSIRIHSMVGRIRKDWQKNSRK